MTESIFHIKINSSEENKDAGFFALITSNVSIQCLDDDEYIVPAKAISKLNDRKINYEMVVEQK